MAKESFTRDKAARLTYGYHRNTSTDGKTTFDCGNNSCSITQGLANYIAYDSVAKASESARRRERPRF